ncbi:uncharacterized protein LOC143361045 isoform X2 [Halictus rubicundus]|uniref:uncharacterized protein LOC143361045 isoform X2 n=1 Tax=Halictus rubicundus TaxID=77578 RepID=UPI0040363233
MDMFRKNYNTYYNVLCITGLWPYDHTFLKKVQRVGYALLTVCCIVIQASTLRLVDISLYNLLQLLSFGFPMLLFFLRYVGFVVNFPVIRSVFDNIEYDCNSLKNPVEMELLMKQIVQSKRVVLSLLGLSCLGIVFAIAVFVVPTVLQSNLQIRYLNILGFFYPEISQHTNFVCCQLLIVTTFGLLTVTCTESSLAVFSSYLCGLFEITSYRIQMAVNAKAHSENSNTLIDIRSAMEMHRRAVESAQYESHGQHDVVVFGGDRGSYRLVRCKFISSLSGVFGVGETGQLLHQSSNLSGTRADYVPKQLQRPETDVHEHRSFPRNIQFAVVLYTTEVAENVVVRVDEKHNRSAIQSRRFVRPVFRRLHHDDELVVFVFYRSPVVLVTKFRVLDVTLPITTKPKSKASSDTSSKLDLFPASSNPTCV